MAEVPPKGLLNTQSYGTVAPYDLNMVQKTQGLLAQGFMKMGYGERDAYTQANKVINTRGGVGGADVTPITGDLIGVQDTYDMGVSAKDAFNRGEYLKSLGYGAGSAATGILSALGVGATVAPPVDKLIDAARVGVKRATGLLDNQYKTPIGPKQPIKAYHGTRADITPNFKFRDDLIGSQTDQGYYGRGHYFTGLPGEASYYGPNVGKFDVNLQHPFDLNYTGDSYAMDDRFIEGYEKVKQFGVTDKLADDSYRVYKEFEDFIDKNVDVIPFQGGGYIARIDHPVLKDVQSGIPSPKGTVEEAKKSLLRKSLDQTRWHTDTYPEIRVDRSMSDLLAGAEGGPTSLSNALKEKGYDGILYGDETIAFDPSNIKVEQTPSFRKWFGNSKVVDEGGKPLTVYHGTISDFDEFKAADFGSGAKSRTGGGNYYAGRDTFFFTDKPVVANDYARNVNGDASGGGNVIPANLSLKNPLVIDDVEGRNWSYYVDDIENARQKGHDGVILKNINDPFTHRTDGIKSTIYAVFEPEKIKSIHNRGTYNPKDANILKSAAPIAGAGLLAASMNNEQQPQPTGILEY